MLKNQIKLGKLFGIEIGLHYSWFIIAFLIVLSIGQRFQATNPEWGGGVIWVAALITGILFFVTLLLHELSHSLVARSKGIPVRSITLFALGGISNIEKESTDPKTEFEIGVIGPVTSLVIGLVCFFLAKALQSDASAGPVLAVLIWLGYINITLGVFNLIPGFPLDGGRVLRAVIWGITKNGARATRIATGVGRGVAYLFIFLGLLQFFTGAGFGGLWLAFIGWFLNEAAISTSVQSQWGDVLSVSRVADIMTHDCPAVPANINLDAFVKDFVLHTGKRCFVVEENGMKSGIVTLQDVKKVNPTARATTTVQEVRQPFDRLFKARPETPVKEALEEMTRKDVNQLAVVSNGHVDGIVSRSDILQLLQTQMELR